MLPPLLLLDTRVVGRLPLTDVRSSGAPNAADSDGDFWNDVSDLSESDDETSETNFLPVYPSRSGMRLFEWGLEASATLGLLCQFAALYAYQAGDLLSKMVIDSYLDRSTTETLESGGLYYEIRALGALRALLFLSKPSSRAQLGPLLPVELAAHLGSENVPLRERAELVEVVLLLLLGPEQMPGSRRRKKTMLKEWNAPGKRALALRAFAELREAPKGPDNRFRHEPRPDARALLDFVMDGLRDAFANPSLLTPLPAGLILYHGGGIVDEYGRRNQHFKDRRDGREATVFERTFVEEVQNFARGPVSTSMDPTVALKFYQSEGYGSIFCFEIVGLVSAIVYSTLDREGPLWNVKPEEREVLLPPGLEYELVPKEFCETRPRLGPKVYRVRVRQVV